MTDKFIQKVIGTDASNDFDLDNWITDFENGFPRFEKVNPELKQNYWGNGFENRPRIKELNEESDAQQIEGYRLVEFFPDRENKEESFLLFGTPLELMTQCCTLMNLHRMIESRDMGYFLGYPIDAYMRRKPQQDVSIKIVLQTKKSPPYFSKKNPSRKAEVNIPSVNISKLSYSIIRQICGNNNGIVWGNYQCRATVSLENDKSPLHQIVASGNTEEVAEKNLKQFLSLTHCKLRGINHNHIDYSEGERKKDILGVEKKKFTVYPAWIVVFNSKLFELNNNKQSGIPTLSGKLKTKMEKLYTYYLREPKDWKNSMNELTKTIT